MADLPNSVERGLQQRLLALRKLLTWEICLSERELWMGASGFRISGIMRDWRCLKDRGDLRHSIPYHGILELVGNSLDGVFFNDFWWNAILDHLDWRAPWEHPHLDIEPMKAWLRSQENRNAALDCLRSIADFARQIPDTYRRLLIKSGLSDYSILLLEGMERWRGFEHFVRSEPYLAVAAMDHFQGDQRLAPRRRPPFLPEDGKWNHREVAFLLGVGGLRKGIRVSRRIARSPYCSLTFEAFADLSRYPKRLEALIALSAPLHWEVVKLLKICPVPLSNALCENFLGYFWHEEIGLIPRELEFYRDGFRILYDTLRLAGDDPVRLERLARKQALGGVIRLHNAWARRDRRERARSFAEAQTHTTWTAPFPEDPHFRFLGSPVELAREAELFDNCALTYLQIAMEEEICFYIVEGGESHMVSFESDGESWAFHQCFRSGNRPATPEAMAAVHAFMEANQIKPTRELPVNPRPFGIAFETWQQG